MRPEPPAGPEAPGGTDLRRLLMALAAVVVGAIVFVSVLMLRKEPEKKRPGVGLETSPAPDEPAAEVTPAPDEGAIDVPSTPTPALVTLPPAPSTPTPPPTAMELAKRSATELLEPLVRPIAKEADGLDLRFRYYLETCRTDFSVPPPPEAGRYWFVIWVSRAEIQWSDDRPEPSMPGQRDAPSCRSTWIELVERASGVASALERLEETARAKDVLPAHIEELLAAHRLTGWRESYFHRGRGRSGS